MCRRAPVQMLPVAAATRRLWTVFPPFLQRTVTRDRARADSSVSSTSFLRIDLRSVANAVVPAGSPVNRNGAVGSRLHRCRKPASSSRPVARIGLNATPREPGAPSAGRTNERPQPAPSRLVSQRHHDISVDVVGLGAS